MSDNASLREPKLLVPFLLITLIWSSTWVVIKDQLGSGGAAVPPPWSVAYRFGVAAAAMFLLTKLQGRTLAIGRAGHLIALGLGIPQFVLNFNFVYAAEQYVTSGIVAVVFALLVVPNAGLAWLFYGHRITARFAAGSFVAMAGVALLFAAELRTSSLTPAQVTAGIGFTLLGVLSASAANVAQASERVRSRPIASLLAWAMLYAALVNAGFAWIVHGMPVGETRIGYWVGVVYLGVVASALAFTVYYRIIREIGPAKAAYSSVLVPIIAMLLSTIFEDYHWTLLAAAGGVLAIAGLVIALTTRTVGAAPA